MAQSDRYTAGDYFAKNPSWDMEDSPWKARLVAQLIEDAGIHPASLCEIGCGAGGVLSALREKFTEMELSGFDIAPAARFWECLDNNGIDFFAGDFFQKSERKMAYLVNLDFGVRLLGGETLLVLAR